jgi:hypothetical protein
MQIFVKTWTGKTLTLEVSGQETGKDLKETIFDKEGVAPDQQHLSYGHNQVNDTHELNDYSIRDQSTLTLTLRLNGGGVNYSKATSTNMMTMLNTTNVSSTQNCYNSQVTEVAPINVILSNINCDNIDIGNLNATAEQSCYQNANISALTKSVLDQVATSEAKTSGLAANLANGSIAESTNIIDIQNNMAVAISANCDNNQRTNIKERNYQINGLNSKGYCKIAEIGISAQMSCTNALAVDLTTDNTVSQTATATATAGIDLGQLIIILLLFFGGGFLISIGGIVMKYVLKGSKAGKVKDPPLGVLSSKLAVLKAKVAARAAKAARDATKFQPPQAQQVPIPPLPIASPPTSPFNAAPAPMPKNPFA